MRTPFDLRFVLVGCAVLLLGTTAEARDDRLKFPIDAAMKQPKAADKLGDDVQFFWGDASHPAPSQEFGTFTSNKKTNAFGKSDQKACEWAWLSAMVSLRDRAVSEGGNAVVGIHSVYKDQAFTSTTEYECGAGGIIAGVALRGQVVKLP